MMMFGFVNEILRLEKTEIKENNITINRLYIGRLK